jgi:hypothetical protein
MGRPTILDRRFEDAPEAVKPDIIGGGYTTLSPRPRLSRVLLK